MGEWRRWALGAAVFYTVTNAGCWGGTRNLMELRGFGSGSHCFRWEVITTGDESAAGRQWEGFGEGVCDALWAMRTS